MKLNVRGGDKKIGFFNGEAESLPFGYGDASAVILRMEVTADNVIKASASTDGGKEWHEAGSCKLPAGVSPSKVRIGKMDATGGNHDFAQIWRRGSQPT